jgi:hypothetical protein
MMGVVNVIARPSGAALPWLYRLGEGKVVVGALIGAHANRDHDVLHRRGMVDDRDFSDYLVVERGVDKAAVKPGSNRRPSCRADFSRGGVTAR